MEQDSREALRRATEIVGGQSALARAISERTEGKIKQGHIWYWLSEEGAPFPAEYCAAVEAATAGAVTRAQLRPDLFGDIRAGSAA
jgi:DNA-binding transcriptional regulator YdaS (Cro superfamily)